MNTPSAHALSQVGKHIKWSQEAPRKRSAEGICIGVRRVPGVTISNDKGTFPAVEFCIEDQETGKKVWTTRFADEGP